MPLLPHHLLLHKNPEQVFTFLVLAYPGCPGKEAVKWVFVLYSFPVKKYGSNSYVLCIVSFFCVIS